VKWQFLAENHPSGKLDWFDTQGSKHAIRLYLRNQTTAQTEYLMGNSTVKNLSECWVYKLSFRKRHPSIQKGKNETPRTYRGKRGNSFRWVNPASLIDPLQEEEWIKFQTKYGIELPASIRIIRVEAVENLSNFKYIYSLLAKNSSIETRYKRFQAHMLSYKVKTCPGWFVYA
jgi:hypothetical protein